MKRIDDEKVRFYLKNQNLIDEWAALSDLVPLEVDRFMRTCSKPIEDLAADLGATFWSVLDGPWRKLFIARSDWKAVGGLPRVGIGLQWRHGVVSFVSPERPVVGVWVDQSPADGAQLSQILKSRFRETQLLERPWQSSAWWPAWRYESASGAYWDDLDGFREQLTQAVRFTWNTRGLHIDAAIHQLSNGREGTE